MANLNDLLTKLKTTTEKRATDLETEWWAAVKAAANGKAVNADKVSVLLERIGRPASEFVQAAELHARRVGLTATAAGTADAAERKAAALAAMKELDAAFEQAEKKYQAERSPHEWEIERAEEEFRAASAARSELFHGCPYPHLRARYEEAKAAIVRAEAKAAELLKNWRQDSEYAGYDPQSERYKSLSDIIAAAKERLPRVAQRLDEARAEVARRKAELAQAEDDMRLP